MGRKKHVLVTGASGFVGSALVTALLERGDRVIAVTHSGGRPLETRHPNITKIPLDLPDLGSLDAVSEVSLVFHTAAPVDPKWENDESVCHAVNVVATEKLANWCIDHAAKMVFVSSIAAMGFRDSPGGLAESSPCIPTSAYGRTKLVAEMRIAELARRRGLKAAIVRVPTLYGPKDRYNFLALCRAVYRRLFVFFGTGLNRMSVMYIDNLVAALLLLGARSAEGIFLADDGVPSTLRSVVADITRALGRRRLPPRLPTVAGRTAAFLIEPVCHQIGVSPPLTASRVQTLTASCGFRTDRLRAAGYQPLVPTRLGIRRTIEAYLARNAL